MTDRTDEVIRERALEKWEKWGREKAIMTDRLLTDEDILEAGITKPWYTPQKDIERLVFQAQDAKTLKAVGEWLREADYTVMANDIDQLKQGRMPE